MNEAASQTRKRAVSRRPLTGKRIMLIVLALLAVSFLAVRGVIAWRYSAELAALREAGLPTNMDELRDWQELPERGAQETYQRAFDALDDLLVEQPLDQESRKELIYVGYAEMPEPGEPLTSAQLDLAEEHLAHQDEALALLHEAAEAGGGRAPQGSGEFPRDVPFLQAASAAEELCFQAIITAERQDAEAALRALQAASYIPSMLDGQKTMIAQLMRATIVGLWISAAEQVMARVPFDADMLATLEESRRRAAGENLSAAEHAMLGQQALVLDPSWSEVPELAEGPLRLAYEMSGLGQLDRLHYMQVVERVRRALKIEPTVDRLERIREMANEPSPAWALQSSEAMETYNRFFIFHYRTRASDRAMAVAIAAYRCYLEQEQRPESLEDLVPRYLSEPPEDPFTGEPMILRAEGDPILIYSAGENGVDDGGDDSIEARENDRHDLGVFELHLPESP